MAWIEFHPTKIKKLQKFKHFRKTLNWSANEALGFFGVLWGEIMDLRENGDITGWTAEYIAEITEAKVEPERLWNALTVVPPELKNESAWIDRTEDGKMLIHDWLDCAGKFLINRYKTSNKARLTEIWALHGRKYGGSEEEDAGSKQEVNRKQTGRLQEDNGSPPNLTLPNLTKPGKSYLVPTPEGLRLAEQLRDWLIRNNPGAKLPKDLSSWALEADRMIRIDQRKVEDIKKIMDWCQTDTFWKVNILSIPKLREKYDQLWLKMKNGGVSHVSKTNGGVTAQEGKYDRIEQ
jgi:hypothetical protein